MRADWQMGSRFTNVPRLTANQDGTVDVVLSAESALDPESPDNPGIVATRRWSEAAGWGPAFELASGPGVTRASATEIMTTAGDRVVAWIEEPAGGLARIEVRRQPRGGGAASRAKIEDGPMSKHGTLRENRPLVLFDGPPEGAAVIWADDREHHGFFRQHANVKLFTASTPFEGDPRVDKVTPPRRTNIAHYALVRGPRAKQPELVFSEDDGALMFPLLPDHGRLYVVTRREGTWGDPFEMTPHLGVSSDRHVLGSIAAFRDPAGRLIVICAAKRISGPGPAVRLWELLALTQSASGVFEMAPLEAAVDTGFMGESFRAAMGPDGTVSVVYPPADSPIEPATRNHSLALIRFSTPTHLSSVRVSARSVEDQFDVAVDSSGRTHVVWLELDGADGVVRHRVISPIAADAP